MWVMYIYGLLVLVTAGSALLTAGLTFPGIAGLAGPALCFWSGSGVKGSLLVGTRSQKIGGLVAGAVFLAAGLAMLYFSGYWVRLWSVELDGVTWGVIGAVLAFIFTPRSMAEASPQRAPEVHDQGEDRQPSQ
jgi:hypothetical protein